ncbi:trypco2 family protein [Nocardia abscessus]|uniref:trypco2 family protein n=1 Tax=Nocardia abscessus TaxID=120957 RepID=UPI0005B826E3|nr:trypco2 family protein [Nocardia abscessus]MCC3326493.1 hypothetical protein [Nocardia abscessus]
MADAPHADWLDLVDALTALRRQLIEAQSRATDSAIKLAIQEVTVEFGLELQRSAKGSGGFRFGVVSADVGGDLSRRATHKVSLKLNALTDVGGPVDVNDEDDG